MFVNLVVIIWRQAVWDLKPVAAGCVSRLLCYYQADAFVLTRKINLSILILAVLDKQLFPAITYLVFFCKQPQSNITITSMFFPRRTVGYTTCLMSNIFEEYFSGFGNLSTTCTLQGYIKIPFDTF